MSKRISLPLLAAVCAFGSPCFAGTFSNLDFENIAVPPLGSWGRLMPSWSPYGGVWNIGLNEPQTWSNALIVYDQECPLNLLFEGRYAVALFPAPDPYVIPKGSPIIQGIFQTGDLSADAGLLHFKNWGERVQVFLGEKEIPISYTGDIGVGDISAFAGQNVTLKFQTLADTTWPQYSALDSIWFSPIPEPSTFALIGFGGLGLGWWLRRRQR